MSQFNCEITEDLLPLYVEEMASPSSKKLVEEHLADCKACRNLAEKMKGEMSLPRNVDVQPLQRLGQLLFRKKVTTVAVTLLSVLLLVVLTAVHLNSPIIIPYEDVAESVQVSVENGHGKIVMNNKGGYSEVNVYETEEGIKVKEINLYTTLWKQITNVKECLSEFEFETEGENAITRVYFFPEEETGASVCLYDGNPQENTDGGMVVLPRLVLNYYLFFAILLAGVGVIICIVLWKKKSVSHKKRFLAVKLTWLFVSYGIATLAVLINQGGIYHERYYFTGILLVTALVYMVGYWIIECIRYSGKRK